MTYESLLNKPDLARSGVQPYYAAVLEPAIGTGGDDAPLLQSAIDHVHALGGGVLLIDRTITLGGNIDCPRTVVIRGVAAQVAIIRSDGTQRRFHLTGQPADTPDWHGDRYVVLGLTFANVSLDVAPTSGDHGRGVLVAFCEFYGSDRALYFGHAFFSGCGAAYTNFRLNTIAIYFDLAAAVVGAGAHLLVTGCSIGEGNVAIHVEGITADGIALYITDTYADHVSRYLRTVNCGEGGVYIKGWGVELCGFGPEDVPFADAYFLENDGANIWADTAQQFAVPVAGLPGAIQTAGDFVVGGKYEILTVGSTDFTAIGAASNTVGVQFVASGVGAGTGTAQSYGHTDAILWNKAGNIFYKVGRAAWENNQFCRIDSGLIIVDQSEIFAPSRLWGTGQAPFAHASSSGGKVVAPRSAFVGRIVSAFASITVGSPDLVIRVAEGYDGNARVWEFDLVSSGTADNSLRLHLADGAHLVRVDLNFPGNLAIGGHVRVVNVVGSLFSVDCVYAPTTAVVSGTVAVAAGSPPTKAEFDAAVATINALVVAGRGAYLHGTATDNNDITATKFLVLSTLGASASTITITNFTEIISGPVALGL